MVQQAMKPTHDFIDCRRALMCKPTAYDLKYEINAWMHVSDRPDKRLAAEQWAMLYETLTQKVGLHIELIDQAKNAPDMVFTANAGLLLPDRRVVLSRFRHPERQVEEAPFERWFIDQGYQVVKIDPDCHFEGEGDCFHMGDFYIAGYRKRSDICSHRILSELTGKNVISVELMDDRWYHLDTCFLPLTNRLVAFYPEAFDTYGRRVIQEHFKAIPVAQDEALRFACNSVVVGKQVVLPANCPTLRFQLEEEGFCTHEVPMSEFLKSGGACKCLTLYLRY